MKNTHKSMYDLVSSIIIAETSFFLGLSLIIDPIHLSITNLYFYLRI